LIFGVDFMTYILDIILILLFFIIVLASTIRGFVKSVWRTVTVVGAFILAYVYGPFLGAYLCESYVVDYVSDYTFESLTQLIDKEAEGYAGGDIVNDAPEELVELLERYGSDINELRNSFKSGVAVSEEELKALSDSISVPIASTIATIIGIFLVFLGGVLLISLIGLVLRLIVKLPIIRFFDSFLGAVFGIAEAFVIVWVLCLLIGFLVEHGFITGTSTDVIGAMIENSYLFRFFCDLSPVDFINIRID
jgi:uncharacterized membrane protein required for colicin V production